jgi:hypothetical protein
VGSYGSCCVVLGLEHWAPYHTCFAGDSIRSCFGREGAQVLSDAEILEGFGIGEDALALSVIRHEGSLGQEGFRADAAWIRHVLESEDSMLEVHLHGPVRRDHIREVRMLQKEYEVLSDLSASFPGARPGLFRFDRVPDFRRVLALMQAHEVRLRLMAGEDD